MKLLGGTGRIENGAFPGSGSSQFEEALPDPPEKIIALLFEAIQLAAPAPDTRAPLGGVEIEDEHMRGTNAGAGDFFELGDVGGVETAPRALIGVGGPGETVGNHRLSGLERRADFFVHQLRARGGIEKEFGGGRHRLRGIQ